MKEQNIDFKRWQYDIAWEIVDYKSLMEENKARQIESQLRNICEVQEIELKDFHLEEKTLSFQLISQEQLNLQKWMKGTKKKLATTLSDLELEDQFIISHDSTKVEDDKRLCKLIDSVVEVDYYDLDEGLIEEDIQKLKRYLKEQALTIIEQQNQIFLIDKKALGTKINLNCFECTKRHQYGCCCGSPCAMSKKNMNLLDKHLIRMEEALKDLDKMQYKRLQAKGGFIAANGEIKSFDGHCSFLIAHEGVYKCMAHKYALDKKIPIYDLCPLSCLMYPLEIMELITDKRKTIFLITAAVQELFAETFSRWGSYKSLEVELRCIHEEEHDEYFRKEDYQTVYEVNKQLLKHEFGKGLLEGMQVLFK